MWQIESLVIVNDWRLHRWSRLLNSTNRLISICLISRTSWLLYVNAIQQPLLISFLLHQVSSCWSLDAALFFLIISKVEVALQLMKTGWLQDGKAFSALFIQSLRWRQSINLNGVLFSASTSLNHQQIICLLNLFKSWFRGILIWVQFGVGLHWLIFNFDDHWRLLVLDGRLIGSAWILVISGVVIFGVHLICSLVVGLATISICLWWLIQESKVFSIKRLTGVSVCHGCEWRTGWLYFF